MRVSRIEIATEMSQVCYKNTRNMMTILLFDDVIFLFINQFFLSHYTSMAPLYHRKIHHAHRVDPCAGWLMDTFHHQVQFCANIMILPDFKTRRHS